MPASTDAGAVGGDASGTEIAIARRASPEAGSFAGTAAPASAAAPALTASSGSAQSPGARSTEKGRRFDGVTLYVAALAVVSATAAVLMHHFVFPVLSINNDEGIYLLHAQTLAEGRLFPQAPRPAGSFTPWLAVVDGDHYVLKYTPFVPGLFAASLLLTGGVSAALAVVAGATVVATYLLGREVFADRRVGAVAATLLAASPLVLVQSALLVGYLPVLLLTELAALGLLRAVRTGRRLPLVVGAFAYGCAASVRPYDVVLVFLPLALWVVVGATGRRWWIARWSAVGVAVPVGVLLASNAAATGSPFSLPFTLLEPSDTIGFGVRRLYPTDIPRQFGILDGLSGVGGHLWLLGGWACAGVLLLGCAVAALVRRRVPGPGVALGAGALLLLVGYLGFWGVWNAADIWGGITYLGPFYVLPVLVPLVLLGARGLLDLAAVRPRLAGGSVAVAAALSVFVAVGAVQTNFTFSRHDQDLAAMIEGQPDQPLVFLGLDPPFLGRPATFLSNPPNLDGDVLYAVSRGQADFAVTSNNPGRSAYLLRVPVVFNETPETRSTALLERLDVVSGRSVEVKVDVDRAPTEATAARVVVTTGDRLVSYVVDPQRGARATFVVSADGVRVTGLGRPTSVRRVAPLKDLSVHLAFYATLASTGKERFIDRYVLPVRTTAAEGVDVVDVMVPTAEVGRVGDGRQPTFHLGTG
jgi:hypothetical protein